MWTCPDYSPDIKEKPSALWENCRVIPVLVIPLTEESVQAMREKLVATFMRNPDNWTTADQPEPPQELIGIVLESLGITASRAKRKAGK